MLIDLIAWLPQAALLFGAALVGGVLNSLSGGGSFLTFPALLLTGVPSVNANATNTAALWPSGLAILSVYRRELRAAPFRLLLLVPSVVDGYAGTTGVRRQPPHARRARASDRPRAGHGALLLLAGLATRGRAGQASAPPRAMRLGAVPETADGWPRVTRPRTLGVTSTRGETWCMLRVQRRVFV
ncbi:MAG TPA: TSUP family transporter [Chloroflexota bacterium]|nr:TSUP family transporter [Chloroflexota bacterium]